MIAFVASLAPHTPGARVLRIGGALILWSAAAVAQSAEKRLPVLRTVPTPLAEHERSKLLVLASPHLSGLGAGFRPALVDSLLTVLRRFKPDVIAVEQMPARLVAALEAQHRVGLASAVQDERIAFGRLAQLRLALSREAAAQQARELLRDAASLSDAQRLQLVLHLLAAYELSTATLQWLHLPDSLRSRNTVIPARVGQYLDARTQQAAEDVSVGIRLAHALGLHEIADVDDWQDELLVTEVFPGIGTVIAENPELQAAARAPVYAEYGQRLTAGATAGNLLPLYTFLNSDDYGARDAAAQWMVWLRSRLPSGQDRKRYALWEARNLSIAANVRRTMATSLPPGGRLLVIIGASHKAFLDSYLAEMRDVRLVQLADLINSNSGETP